MDLSEEEIRAQILQDDRPWGNFRRFSHNQECTVKILTVEAGGTLSLQAHKTRDELW
ncbi:MAG: mannose-6-phosphate isomerase, partial [Actinomycetota bacterium]